MRPTRQDYDPDDDSPWEDNPLLHLMKQDEPEQVPIRNEPEEKVELIAYNECPCCGGKGFVKIIHEKVFLKRKKGK